MPWLPVIIALAPTIHIIVEAIIRACEDDDVENDD